MGEYTTCFLSNIESNLPNVPIQHRHVEFLIEFAQNAATGTSKYQKIIFIKNEMNVCPV